MMNTREEFVTWYKKEYGINPDDEELTHEERSHILASYKSWLACQVLNDKRIAELEEKLRVANLRPTYSSTGESNWD